MLYTTITIGKKEYKCRLSARALVDCERRLKTNPINVFMGMATNNEVPSLEAMLIIFHSSLEKYNHGITLDDTYDLYDTYCEEGNDFTGFIQNVIVPIVQGSGLIPTEEEVVSEEHAKN